MPKSKAHQCNTNDVLIVCRIESAKGNSVNIRKLMMDLSLDVIAQAAFGESIEVQKGGHNTFAGAIQRLIVGMFRCVGSVSTSFLSPFTNNYKTLNSCLLPVAIFTLGRQCRPFPCLAGFCIVSRAPGS